MKLRNTTTPKRLKRGVFFFKMQLWNTTTPKRSKLRFNQNEIAICNICSSNRFLQRLMLLRHKAKEKVGIFGRNSVWFCRLGHTRVPVLCVLDCPLWVYKCHLVVWRRKVAWAWVTDWYVSVQVRILARGQRQIATQLDVLSNIVRDSVSHTQQQKQKAFERRKGSWFGNMKTNESGVATVALVLAVGVCSATVVIAARAMRRV